MNEAHESTLLVVEDEANDRFLIERAARKARILNPLQMVTNGEEAVSYLKGERDYADRHAHPLPILVLLDLKLPRRSGIEVLSWIRGSPTFHTLPVVVLTSSPDSGDVQRAYQAGANSYLVKPVAFEGLQQMMESLGLYWLVLSRLPGVGDS